MSKNIIKSNYLITFDPQQSQNPNTPTLQHPNPKIPTNPMPSLQQPLPQPPAQQTQPTITEQPLPQHQPPQPQQQHPLTRKNENLSSRTIEQEEQPNERKSSQQQQQQKRGQLGEEHFFEVMDLVEEHDSMVTEMNRLYTEGMLAIASVKFVDPYSSLSTKGYKPTPAIRKVGIREGKMGISQRIDSQERSSLTSPQFSLISDTRNIRFTRSVMDSINRSHHPSSSNPHQYHQQHQQQQQQQSQSQSTHQPSLGSSISTTHHLYSYQEQQQILQQQDTLDQCRTLIESLGSQTKQDHPNEDNQTATRQEFLLQRFSIENQKDAVRRAMQVFDGVLGVLIEMARVRVQVGRVFAKVEKEDRGKEKQGNNDQEKSGEEKN